METFRKEIEDKWRSPKAEREAEFLIIEAVEAKPKIPGRDEVHRDVAKSIRNIAFY